MRVCCVWSGPRDVPDAAGGEQGGPGARARRERGGGPRPGAGPRRALRRDLRQGAAAQHRRGLPRGNTPRGTLTHSSEEAPTGGLSPSYI